MRRITAFVMGLLWAGAFAALAQTTPTEYQWIFNGFMYETNAAGKIVQKPVNQHTFVAQAAAAAGITNMKSIEICYHVGGSSFGDTIDLINPTNGAVLDTVFGFYFGQDQALNRYAMTNGTGNEVIVINYIYTKQSNDSVGAALMTFHYTTNKNGTVRMSVSGPMHWLVEPSSTGGATIGNGNFHTGLPLF